MDVAPRLEREDVKSGSIVGVLHNIGYWLKRSNVTGEETVAANFNLFGGILLASDKEEYARFKRFAPK